MARSSIHLLPGVAQWASASDVLTTISTFCLSGVCGFDQREATHFLFCPVPPVVLAPQRQNRGAGEWAVNWSLALSLELCAWVLKAVLNLWGPELSYGRREGPFLRWSFSLQHDRVGCCGTWKFSVLNRELAEALLETALPLIWVLAGEVLQHIESWHRAPDTGPCAS